MALMGTTWVFNDTLGTAAQDISVVVNFICNNSYNLKCTDLEVYVDDGDVLMKYDDGNISGGIPSVMAYADVNGWMAGDEYKTITFLSEPTSYAPNESQFLSWLESNAEQVDQAYIAMGSELKKIAIALRNKAGGTSGIAFPNGYVSKINGIANKIVIEASHEVEIYLRPRSAMTVQIGETIDIFRAYDTNYISKYDENMEITNITMNNNAAGAERFAADHIQREHQLSNQVYLRRAGCLTDTPITGRKTGDEDHFSAGRYVRLSVFD